MKYILKRVLKRNAAIILKIKTVFKKKEYKKYKGALIHITSKIIYKELVSIGNESEIKDFVILQGNIKIGAYCQINPFTVMYGGEIIIGDHVMIAPHCMIASGNHEYRTLDQPMRFSGWYTEGPIVIEDDVWIGANCTITDNVKIGKGAVIAANSCVVKDVDPYSIMGGVPAKKIGSRIQ